MKKKKVLVVDDEKDFLKIIKLNLEQTDEYEVSTLMSAQDILSHVREFRPDIILIDILMPKVGGIEACQMLNDDDVGKTIPVIVLSALDKEIDKLKAYKSGVVDYLIKPVDINELIGRIEKALRYK